MKRLLILLSVPAAVLACLYLVAVSSITAESVGYRLVRLLHAETGLALIARGTPRLDLYPRPRLILDEVVVADSGRRISGTVATLTADIDIAALLASRTRFARILLDAPVLAFDLRSAASEPLDETLGKLFGAGAAVPRRVGMRGATLVLRRADDAFETLSAADLDIAGPQRDGAVSITGTATRNGHRLQITARIDGAATLADGAPHTASLTVRSAGTGLDFEGHAVGFPQIDLDGTFVLRTDDLADLLGAAGAAGGPAVSASLRGRGRLGNGALTLDDARLRIGEALGVGVLSLHRVDGRVTVDATLAFEHIDATPWLARLRRAEAFRRPIGLPAVLRDLIDMDLRLSATKLSLGDVEIDRFAGSVIAGKDRLIVDVGGASLFRGTAAGRLAVEIGAAGVRTALDLAAERIVLADVGRLFGDGFGVDGRMSLRFNGAGSARTPVQLLREFAGGGTVSVDSPRVSRIGLARLLAGGGEPASLRPGDAGFAEARADIAMGAGRLVAEPVTVTGDALSLSGRIAIDLVAGAYDVSGTADVPPAATGDAVTDLPFALSGTFPTPPELARRARPAAY